MNIRAITDKTAIGLSVLCAIHCVVFPIALVLLPWLAFLPLESEAFHFWMLVAVIPTSSFAMFIGWKEHHNNKIILLGFIGLSIMVAAVMSEHALPAGVEKILTLAGTSMIAIGHIWNFRLCRTHQLCTCDPKNDLT